MNNEELLKQFGKLIDSKLDEKLEPIKMDVQTMKQVVTHISTGVKALAAGQLDVREQVKTLSEKVATKADVQEIKADLVKHQRRIENLEDNTSTPNPHKN